ncbi:MAG: AMP-binding protein, partial [Treponema sp.]|nr:AMP-binding protein [Treponema sp.]
MPGTGLFGSLLFLGIGVVCLITNVSIVLKLYPALTNGVLLAVFGGTLFFPPSMIYRFAVLQDKSIAGSLAEKQIARYCRKVTVVWCVFFICNGGIALYTVFFVSDAFWSMYNGGISYILIGTLFTGEFIVRKMTDKKMPKAVPLSRITGTSRASDGIICYDRTYSTGIYRTWKDFLDDTSRMRRIIQRDGSLQWILYCEDCWYFLVAFTALLQCKKQVLLTANISPGYIKEIRTPGTAFLTDHLITGTLHIPSLLSDTKAVDSGAVPRIDPDETVIILYTSGTTGKPKAVQQRLTEFETDNGFVLSKWGNEVLQRKVCSTVSQHHIY